MLGTMLKVNKLFCTFVLLLVGFTLTPQAKLPCKTLSYQVCGVLPESAGSRCRDGKGCDLQ